ncbi:alpha/beta fold hydrolase [Mobilicoccus pelagius]|uniref:Putative hydrolase n=1 Tax=Mobilicoccus pelagius NBRC 104925 TaxID=1089455 RepID=H5UUW7_9MICO|nr:alpha/beta hydrolase [Mobilicoccus pelagius]GAB49525.1 putative hydrolase [Mobilicoccus pelagius NBRC 104925]
MALALALGVALGGAFRGGDGVGSWRSVEGRAAYLVAYEEAMRSLPRPDTVEDVATSYGTARLYGWRRTDRSGPTDPIPVVLLPGMRSGTPMWADQVRELRRHRDVYALDAVGDAGLSTQSVPLREQVEQAAWIEDALAGASLPRVHVVGHSFGGALAAAHASRHPERVASLTLLEPAFTLAYPAPATFVWATVASLPGVPATWREHALAQIGGVDVAEVRTDDPLGRMIALATEHYDGHAPTPTPLSEKAIRGLTMPVYVALAERDSLAGGTRAADRARTLPHGLVETWAHTTHSLPMQTGPALTDRLDAWWRTLGS